MQLLGRAGSQPKVEEEKTKHKSATQKKKHVKRNQATFQPRSEKEVRELVQRWEEYAHPRAREFFTSTDMLKEVLTELASSINQTDDPILGPEEKCVYWYGDVTKDDQQAAIRMVKPGETAESVTYASRVLAFIFATDESFEQLRRLPKEPFKMSCDDQLCVNLAHISLSV